MEGLVTVYENFTESKATKPSPVDFGQGTAEEKVPNPNSDKGNQIIKKKYSTYPTKANTLTSRILQKRQQKYMRLREDLKVRNKNIEIDYKRLGIEHITLAANEYKILF